MGNLPDEIGKRLPVGLNSAFSHLNEGQNIMCYMNSEEEAKKQGSDTPKFPCVHVEYYNRYATKVRLFC